MRTAFLGWVPVAIAVGIGMVVKSLLNRFWPVTARRIERSRTQNNRRGQNQGWLSEMFAPIIAVQISRRPFAHRQPESPGVN